MKNVHRILFIAALFLTINAKAQDSTGLTGTPIKEVQYASDKSPYLTQEWYRGLVRDKSGKPYDGVLLNYDLVKDQIIYKNDSSAYVLGPEITEFNIPTGTALYTFKRGFPAAAGLTDQSFYQVLYDGNTKLLKHYKKSGSGATDESLYILKGDKLTPIQLKDRNSFLKVLSDEKNKMQYVIKEENLDFDGADDVAKLLAEYDAYKAGRGGN
ncbi:hypothetical protein ACFP1I_24730 [Dyadobacter subterraneus]|uniref:Uncharacterized protein n=1 Tax=Dyadobacter subterraneus TaxID=2773304 RepID=A0ABR9WLF3_9BACT|nr:hypothetical protein [Dyadobacter subterraneus]MBE9466348.1 hypothetical protein [Dyadobacter subterraneus]